MPQLKVKTVYIEKLKALGVYDQWLENLKKQWSIVKDRKTMLEASPNFNSMISRSFLWTTATGGGDFWLDISHK